jgi:hypothetical protein
MKEIKLIVSDAVYGDIKNEVWAYGLCHGAGSPAVVQALAKIWKAIDNKDKEVTLQFKKEKE